MTEQQLYPIRPDPNQTEPGEAGAIPAYHFLRRLFAPPAYADVERSRIVRLLNTVLLIMIGATLLAYLSLFLLRNPLPAFGGISFILLAEFVALAFLRFGKEKAAALILVAGMWLGSTAITVVSEGIANSGFISLVLVVIIAGLTLGARTGLFFAGLSTLTGIILLIAKVNDLLMAPMIQLQQAPFLLVVGVLFFAIAGLIMLATSSLQTAVERAWRNESAQIQANRELLAIRASLEDEVKARTRELQQRSSYLQTAVEVSRATASILDTEKLISEAVELIRSQFGLYYVGLFILDSSGEWAILRAGTGQAGKIMLVRGHRIRTGSGMVGWSIVNAQPRIAADIEKDSVRLATSELPDTRSEAAFPLRSRGKVLGALTVQSDKPEAFGEVEISTFQALADQLGIGLDNANLFAESQRALHEAQMVTRQTSGAAWQAYLQSGANLAFRYDHGQIIPSPGAQDLGMSDALDKISLPIAVREQVIGMAHFSKQIQQSQGIDGQGADSPTWTEDELALLRTIVEQLGIALDSARLYAETRQRAEQERLISEIASQMRASLDVETVLQTAAEEIYQTLKLDNLVIQLVPSDDSSMGQSVEQIVENK